MGNSEVPRRARMDQWTKAERAIYDACLAVEAMPADVRLTDAVTLLGAAKDSVADYVDGIDRRALIVERSNDYDKVVERANREAAGRVRVHLALAEAVGGEAASRINDERPPEQEMAEAPSATSGEAPDVIHAHGVYYFRIDLSNHHNAATCPYCTPTTQPAAQPDAPTGGTLSLSIERDALGISALLDDSTREREMLRDVIRGVRRALGEDGRDVLLLDLPKVVARKTGQPTPPDAALVADGLKLLRLLTRPFDEGDEGDDESDQRLDAIDLLMDYDPLTIRLLTAAADALAALSGRPPVDAALMARLREFVRDAALWRYDDTQGYDGAIALVCRSEELAEQVLAALSARPAAGAAPLEPGESR